MPRDWPFQAAANVLALLVPIIVSVLLCYQVAVNNQRDRAAIMAEVVLNRGELASEQLMAAFDRLKAFEPASACSPEALATMRSIGLSSSLLQGLGYLQDGALLCSTLGDMGVIDVGPADYISATNHAFRRQRNLPVSPETPLLLVTGEAGFTGLFHPGLIFDLIDPRANPLAGIVSFSQGQNMTYSGGRAYDWSKVHLPDDQHSGTVMLGKEIVAWIRSSTRDQLAYAALPFALVLAAFWAALPFYLLGGIVVSVAALLVTRQLVANRTSLPALLKLALTRSEIHTVYQPIVDMRTGRWIGAEALARWRRPSGEWIAPDVFVPIAERFGLMRLLTRRVLTHCADDLAGFVALSPDFFVSVNISSVDLQDPEFVDTLVAECDARNIPHHRVHLEITERTEVNPARVSRAIHRLTQLDFEVGIDDFGIGYSNLTYLDNLDVDYLKVDKAFVAGIANGAIGTAIVDHIITLGSERGLTVIAEGVEVEQQRAELVARGVLFGQGWLFARPMAPAALVAGYRANQSETNSAPGEKASERA